MKNSLVINIFLGSIFCAMIVASFLFNVHKTTEALVTGDTAVPFNRYLQYTFFASTTGQTVYSTTTNATSTVMTGYQDSNGRLDTGALSIAGAKEVTFYFSRTGVNGNQGSSVFSVQVTPDGTNWYNWGKWIENASSTSGFTPIATSRVLIPIVGTSSAVEAMNLSNDAFLSARCIAVKVTDGENSCTATVQY